MKKFYLLCTTVMAMFATTAQADRILYSENYEMGGVPATWTVNGGTGSIAGDSEGKYFSFALGQNNGRSAHCLWGEGVFDPVKEGLEEYAISIDFQYQAFGNNQYNGELAVFSGEACEKTNGNKGGNWDPYSIVSPNCFFDLSQSEAAIKEMETKDPSLWYLNGDVDNSLNLTAGTWYTLVLKVNVKTKEVEFTLDDLDGTFHKTGTKTMADDANLYASGLYLMNARYQSVINIDNIKVTVPGDYANDPVIALTGLNNEERTYTVTFMEGETLHVTDTEGKEVTVGYYDGEVPGAYSITTTTSGTIKAYTTAGSMTSQTIEQEVVCESIVLPAPTWGIVTADEGFAKTYQFNVDNSGVEMQPTIFMDFSFKSEDGSADFELANQNNGANVKLATKGTLTITTKALGYANGSATLVNDQEFEKKLDIDLQHITAEQLAEKGFEKIDDLNSATTSGESNWTARLRMNLKIATGETDEEGNPTYTTYPVYGYTTATVKQEDGTEIEQNFDYEPIQRYVYYQSKLTEATAAELFAPLILWHDSVNVAPSITKYYTDGVPNVDHLGNTAGSTDVKFYPGIGLVFSGQLGDGGTFYLSESATYAAIAINNVTMSVDGLNDEDFIVVSKINDYGTGSVHPEFPAGTDLTEAIDQYKAMHLGNVFETYKGTESFQLYRVDTALSRVLVLTPKGGTAIQTVGMQTVSDKNAPVYNLNGVQMSGALKKGVYIKQGKKFVVK